MDLKRALLETVIEEALEEVGHDPVGYPASLCSGCGDPLDDLAGSTLEPGCPVCRGNDELVTTGNISKWSPIWARSQGSTTWAVCHEHHGRWLRNYDPRWAPASDAEAIQVQSDERRIRDYKEVVPWIRLGDLALKALSGVCPECGGCDAPLETEPGFWFTCREHEVKWFQPEDGPWGSYDGYQGMGTPIIPASDDPLERLMFEATFDHYREIQHEEAVSECPRCRSRKGRSISDERGQKGN